MGNWKYVCPICNKAIEEDYTEEEIRENWTGATHDCPECNGLILINEDLTCSDFGKYLSNIYVEMGVKVSPEEAVGSYVEL